MPPVTQQGSRAGLITALVIFVLFFCVATGFSIYYYIELDKSRISVDPLKKKIDKLAGEKADNYVGLPESANKPTAVDALEDRILSIAKLIDPNAKAISGDDPTKELAGQAEKSLKDAVAGANAKTQGITGAQIGKNDVMTALQALASTIRTQEEQIVKLKGDMDAAEKAYAANLDQLKAELKKKDDAIASSQTETVTERGKVAPAVAAEQAKITDLTTTMSKQVTESKEQTNVVLAQLQQKQAETAALQQQIEQLKKRLAFLRLDVKSAMMTQPDGVVVRVSGSNAVFINLGMGDQISPGLTFEVYDRNEGIPNVLSGNANEETLPMGKASIEVINVGAQQSECRIVRKNSGANLAENDLIANLIYNKNSKLHFCIYPGAGFDLNQDGRANPADTEVLKRLVNKWGGAAMDDVAIETDFLVLGKEPVLPKLDPNDPDSVAKHNIAKKLLEDYDKMRSKALDLHIPILNQNRFLYYIGYYDMAKKGM